MAAGRPGRWAAALLVAAAIVWLISAAAGGGWTAGARALAGRASPGASAASADVARVRADIENALAGMTWRVRTGGRVIVAERDGAFHIVVPAVVVEGRNGRALDVGDVEIVAAPRPDGRYDARVVVPATMGLIDENGAWTAQLTIGGQRFEGVWAPEFGLFVELDAAWRDIRAAAPGDPPEMTLGAATMMVDYTETAPDLWGSQSSLRFSDLEMAGDDGVGRVRIGALEFRWRGQGIRLAELSGITRELDAALRRQDESEPLDGMPPDLLRLLGAMPRLVSSSSMEATVVGIDVEEPTGTRSFGLERAKFRLAIKGLDEERSRIEVRYEHHGLDVAAAESIVRDLVPRRMVFDAAAVDLPNEALGRAIADYARAAAESAADGAEDMLLERLSAALFEAASAFTVNRLTADAPNMSLEASGTARAAAHGAVGAFDAVLRGLDTLAASLSATPGDAAMQAAMIMAMVDALGEAGVDESGVPTRRYRFEMTADGAVLLNGNDVQGLFGGRVGQVAPGPRQ